MPSKQYTHQETFDIVARALAAQGRKSHGVQGGLPRCLYRAEDGCKCAAGHLIPNGRYTEAMEGRAVVVGADDEATIAGEAVVAEGHDLLLTAELQIAHDAPPSGDTWLGDWADHMRRLAGKRGLSTTALDEALAARAAS